jgi:ATP-dependent Zn protease
MCLPGTDAVHKISIIPRGVGALGYTMQRPSEDRYLARRSELRNRLAVLLGGRAAEMLVLGEVSTGAADDLVKAINIAHDMVTRWGIHVLARTRRDAAHPASRLVPSMTPRRGFAGFRPGLSQGMMRVR